MATLKGTTQKKRKREPHKSAWNMPRELSNALSSLLRRGTSSIAEEVNVLIANYTEKDLQDAVLLKGNNGWLPIHCACWKNAPLEVIQMLLDTDTEKKTILEKGTFGHLPIHTACCSNAPAEVIQLLLDSDTEKRTILKKDTKGFLPIHCACCNNVPIEVIQLLLNNDSDEKLIFEKDHFGRLPIHLACMYGAPVEVIQELLHNDTKQKSILEKDNFGRLPIHLVCLNNGPVEVIQVLLQVSICDRIEQLGLAQWKIDVKELINAMTEDDSNMETVKEIYERLSKYEEMEHTISLLGLAVWRTSCLHWGDIKFKSMQQMEDLRATDGAFDPAEYKRERRIKSGAGVIIRGVLPFLPVDDETPTPQMQSSSSASDDDSDSESSVSDDDGQHR
jgi:ankyrin repeat protein